jgi:hypothetical protein
MGLEANRMRIHGTRDFQLSLLEQRVRFHADRMRRFYGTIGFWSGLYGMEADRMRSHKTGGKQKVLWDQRLAVRQYSWNGG